VPDPNRARPARKGARVSRVGDLRPCFDRRNLVHDPSPRRRCRALIARAGAAGATIVRPTSDQFYGERSGTIRDPFGHEWNIGHEIENVTSEEMQRRYDAMFEHASR